LQAGLRHQAGNIHKGLAVFMGGRGVHDDQTGDAAVNPQVAPKTGIYRGWSYSFWQELMRGGELLQPSSKGMFALRISPNYRGLKGGMCMQK
jgi:hypothetical protein